MGEKYLHVISLLLFLTVAGRMPAQVQRPTEERSVPNFDLTLNRLNYIRAYYPQLDGAGLAVSIKEMRFDSSDMDLRGRYLSSGLAAGSVNTHATDMASIIGGSGNSFINGLGIAPSVQLSSVSYFNFSTEPDSFFLKTGIRVQNHSYGLPIDNRYSIETQAYDRQAYELPDLLHVFSVGNKGDSTSISGPYRGIKGYANVSGNFKMAKNILTVGAVDSFARIEDRSSRGPAYDGRIKPELVAYSQDGSSGAAAIASGLAILLQQAYLESKGEMPSSALVRALLINSADDYGSPGPDYAYGYGLINAYRALRQLQAGQYEEDALSDKEIKNYAIQVPDHARNLRITLVWTDPPAEPGAPKALINDLDLRLQQRNTGTLWLPWSLSTEASVIDLARPAQRTIDRLNNQEQITIEEPVEGRYTILVSGNRVGTKQQSFALVYSYDTIGQFEWTFPSAGDHVFAGTQIPVRWQSTGLPGLAQIAYRPVGAQQWIPIADSVLLNPGFWQWKIPDTLTRAQLRLRSGDQQFVSDPFTINPSVRLQLLVDCPESRIFGWPSMLGAKAYRVYALEESQMKPLVEVSDTNVIIPGTSPASQYFAVAPILQDGSEGLRSQALNLDFQTVGCYIEFFRPGLDVNTESIILDLELGSTYQVQEIWFEKLLSDGRVRLSTFSSPRRKVLQGVDPDPLPGENTYQAKVLLADGSVLKSEPASYFYIPENTIYVYPNPVPIKEGFLVATRTLDDARFQVVDALGRILIDKQLRNEFEFFNSRNFESGLHFYHVYQGKKRVFSGKLVFR